MSQTGAAFARYHDEFRKQCPFPIVATNLEGVYAIPAPPEDFDPTKATATELVKNGILWRQPTVIDNPALASAWHRIYSRKWEARKHIVPRFETQIGKTHEMKQKAQKTANTAWEDTTWSGAVILNGGPWGIAVGIWDIPTVSKPTEPQGTEGGWDSSSWVGIDGFNPPGITSNDVLQAGVQQKVDAQGNPAYIAWWEWFAPKQPGSPSYVDQTDFANFQVDHGHQVLSLVAYIPLLAVGRQILWGGYLVFANLTTGHQASAIAFPPSNATFAGNTVEWIMEVPNFGPPTASLPKFTPVAFTQAGVGGYTRAVGNPQYADTVVSFLPGPPKRYLTAVTTGNGTVTIDFIG